MPEVFDQRTLRVGCGHLQQCGPHACEILASRGNFGIDVCTAPHKPSDHVPVPFRGTKAHWCHSTQLAPRACNGPGFLVNVRPFAQKIVGDSLVPFLGGEMQRRQTILVHWIHVDRALPQQLNPPFVARSSRQVYRQVAVVIWVVRSCPGLQKDTSRIVATIPQGSVHQPLDTNVEARFAQETGECFGRVIKLGDRDAVINIPHCGAAIDERVNEIQFATFNGPLQKLRRHV
mmetsp:Transcript_54004/g.127527  ORF Transcript_54004/g.127527 Transcript_54004/m.127527 type:complete len:232 (-) Transcript_54004:480-1175(-)